jgi:hypothetical protein
LRRHNPVFFEDRLEVGMRKAVSRELLHEIVHGRLVPFECRYDLGGLGFDDINVSAGQFGLPVQNDRERATNHDEGEQQCENLMSQGDHLIHQVGLHGEICFRFIHGN